jgi:hypothetical protein
MSAHSIREVESDGEKEMEMGSSSAEEEEGGRYSITSKRRRRGDASAGVQDVYTADEDSDSLEPEGDEYVSLSEDDEPSPVSRRRQREDSGRKRDYWLSKGFS